MQRRAAPPDARCPPLKALCRGAGYLRVPLARGAMGATGRRDPGPPLAKYTTPIAFAFLMVQYRILCFFQIRLAALGGGDSSKAQNSRAGAACVCDIFWIAGRVGRGRLCLKRRRDRARCCRDLDTSRFWSIGISEESKRAPKLRLPATQCFSDSNKHAMSRDGHETSMRRS